MLTSDFGPCRAVQMPVRCGGLAIGCALLVGLFSALPALAQTKDRGDAKPESKQAGPAGKPASKPGKEAAGSKPESNPAPKNRPVKKRPKSSVNSVAANLQTWRCTWLRGEDPDTGIVLPVRTDSTLLELTLSQPAVNWQGVIASDVTISDSAIQWQLPAMQGYFQLDRYSLEVYRRQNDFRGKLVTTEVFQCAAAGKRAL